MLQSELNSNWIQTILYYCYQINSSVYFDIDATECGAWGYDEDGNLIIVDWYIDGSPNNISQPSNETLLGYTLSTVLTFFNQKYYWPGEIDNHQPFFQLSTSNLNSIPSDRLTVGYLAYDTTATTVKKWAGSILGWVGI